MKEAIGAVITLIIVILIFCVSCSTQVQRNDKEVLRAHMSDEEVGEFVGACATYYGVARSWKYEVAKEICRCMLVEQIVLFGDKFKEIDKDERRKEQNRLIERSCVIRAQAKILEE